jgi:hypothetical protein
MSRITLTLAISVLVLGLLIPSMLCASPAGSDDLFAPVFITRPDQLSFSHCDTARFTFQAVSAITGLPSPWIRYRLVSGPGSIDSITGEWTLPASSGHGAVGAFQLVLEASEFFVRTEGAQNLQVPLYIFSIYPHLRFSDISRNSTFEVNPYQTSRFDFTYLPFNYCDSFHISLSTEQSGFHGLATVELSASGGTVVIEPTFEDAGHSYQLAIIVRTQYSTALMYFTIAVSELPARAIRIQSIHNQFQGQFCDVAVSLDVQPDNVAIGGFDFLIAYDNSALSLQGVSDSASLLYSACKWEYFTYRYGANGNCSAGCPSGLVRVFGMSETNNGDFHPSCLSTDIGPLPIELFRMKFLIANNRTFQCQHIPVQFFWIDCGDNVVPVWGYTYNMIESRVFDRDSAGLKDIQVDPSLATLPGYAGIPVGACYDSSATEIRPNPKRIVDFYNGSINIVCAESIDARKCFYDTNPWNLYHDGYLAGYVRYCNYFLQGIQALGSDTAHQRACSDINADGVPLSVADLMYLARIAVGDALPYPKTDTTSWPPSPNRAHVVGPTGTQHVLWIDTPDTLGAAYFEFEDSVHVSLYGGASHNLITYFDGTNTHVVVAPNISGDLTPLPSGFLLDVWGRNFGYSIYPPLLHAEVATFDGRRVETIIDGPTGVDDRGTNLPTQFALHQNYPNPFNAGTVIDFDLPTSADVSLDIFNILGQTVWSSASHYTAGTHRIEWLGNMSAGGTASSGVYYYRLTAGSFVETRKMVLLK